MNQYGPFASIITVAAALVAIFSLLLLKAVGPVGRWTKQLGQEPDFMVTAGARALAVAFIAVAFLLINKNNYLLFAVASVIFAVLTAGLIIWFDLLRKIHIHAVPVVGASGGHATTAGGKPLVESFVIGTEDNMLPGAKRDFITARKRHGGLSVTDFMSGYGVKPNNPSTIWSRPTLAAISNKMTLVLMGILLSAVMTLYLAALAIEVHQHSTVEVKASSLSAEPPSASAPGDRHT